MSDKPHLDETVARARLPGLDIEIRRRIAPEDRAELVAVSIRAATDLSAAADALVPALLAYGPWWPIAMWWNAAQAMNRAFVPWLPTALPRPEDRR